MDYRVNSYQLFFFIKIIWSCYFFFFNLVESTIFLLDDFFCFNLIVNANKKKVNAMSWTDGHISGDLDQKKEEDKFRPILCLVAKVPQNAFVRFFLL